MRMRVCHWPRLNEGGRLQALRRPSLAEQSVLRTAVDEIVAKVRQEGDEALFRLTRELDGVSLTDLRVSPAEIAAAEAELPETAVTAIIAAINNVQRFHAAQISPPLRVETAPGVICERISLPLESVGLYVPAGRAPLPSTAIMLGVPSAIAGCTERVLCTPPRPDGRADPAVLFAAHACGIDTVFKVGGAQAIAAMAYGTASCRKS